MVEENCIKFRYNKNFKLIDESYNANPLSVKNAIDNFNSILKNINLKNIYYLAICLNWVKNLKVIT